jgi:decaprenylphospho-beta-D-erythro-pentofuranosid-2-ulose 2-reductase
MKMKNGVGVHQNIVLFGGTSDIGVAILREILQPGVARVVLVSRDIARSEVVTEQMSQAFPEVDFFHIRWDAADASSMQQVVSEVVNVVSDIDVAIIAQGLLNEGRDYFADPAGLVEMTNVNFTGTMSLMYGLGAHMRSQGYGKIVLLSSVAGERVRRANPAYGATKAGIDGFALALDHELSDTGVSILIVRPGFVDTKMTAGMKKAPLSTDAQSVARATMRALSGKTKVIWVPGALRWLFLVLKNLPLVIWRRLPF